MTSVIQPAIAELAAPDNEDSLEDYLSRPTPGTMHAMANLTGDLLILGAGGKMGFSLSQMARRSLDAAANHRRVIAVSRFTDSRAVERFHQARIETIAGDLLSDGALGALPDAANVIYLVGMKFGTSETPARTWALNVFLPGLVAGRFASSRIVALSTGNVYPFSDGRTGGAVETDTLGPVGEYAQSCLGRERMFEYFSDALHIPATLIRLNYANALRYGVLTDLAMKVKLGHPIDMTTGHVNVIWQGDANAVILQSLALCDSPPSILNVSGPEMASVRWLATRLASLMGAKPPTFVGTEASTALLSNCARQYALFGYPSVPLGKLLEWTAEWVSHDRPTWDKPTHFEAREGSF